MCICIIQNMDCRIHSLSGHAYVKFIMNKIILRTVLCIYVSPCVKLLLFLHLVTNDSLEKYNFFPFASHFLLCNCIKPFINVL